MKNIKYKNYLLFALTLMLIISSCKKFVAIAPPRNQVTTEQVFADSANANAALLGIYYSLGQSYISYGSFTYTLGLYADELKTTSTNSDIKAYFDHTLTPNNNTTGGFWRSPYSYIYMANACLEGIIGSKNISKEEENILMGEAYGIRGFMHFMLFNFFGEMPIVTSTDYEKNRLLPKASVDSIYTQVISDLKLSQSLLSPSAKVKDRLGYYAITALLARVYLYKRDYQSAVVEANKIINSGNYILMPNLKDVFLATSKEAIWQLAQAYPGRETWEAYFLIPSSATATPTYFLTDTLFHSFELGDKRKTDWIGINTVSSKTYPYPFKYKKRVSSGAITEKFVVLRLAEQYLIRAEARANLNDITGSLADINIIRNRAGLPDATAINKAEALLLIEKERQHEFFCETGHRWFDLKRINRASAVLSGIKPNWNERDLLFPIYYSEINSNPMLTQNEGY